MADLKEILRIDDRALEFLKDIDVIKALETLKDTFREKQDQLEEFEVSDVFELIDSIEEDEELFAALEELGVDAQEVRDAVAEVSDSLGSISEEQRQLLQPLSNFSSDKRGLVDWDILDVGADEENTTAVAFSFDVGAETTLEFEAASSWTAADAGMPDPLLRLGLDGNFRANADVSIPLKLGALGVSTANMANAGIDYFFDPADRDEVYAAAVWRKLDNLCNPFSLDSIWRNIESSDLRGITATSDGSASLQVEIGIAEGFTIAEELATAEAGLAVTANVKRAAKSMLTVAAKPDADGAPERLDVTLSRERLHESGRTIELSVDIDLSGLAQRLREILNHHLQDFQAFVDEYKEFLTPGTYIRDQLSTELAERIEAAIEDTDVQDILKQALAGALGESEDAALPALDKFLAKEITDRLDELGEVVTGEATKVAQDVVEKIGKKLNIDTEEVLGSLRSEVTTLVAKLQTKVSEEVSDASDSTLEKLTKSIEKAGVEVSGAVATADEALEGFRTFLGRYEGLLKELIGHTEDAAKTRITAKLTHEETISSGTVIDAKMSISRNSTEAQTAFDNLIRGDMHAILKDLNADSGDFEYDADGTSLTSFATLHKKLGFEMVMLGFEVGSETIFDANAHITTDGAGRISVVSDAIWQRRRDAGDEERHLKFVDAFELAAASATRRLSVDLSISHKDESLKVPELKKFLKSFQDAGLLPEGTSTRAANILAGWIGSGRAKDIQADVNIGLSFSEDSSKRLLLLESRSNGELPEAERKRLFSLAMQELVESKAFKQSNYATFARIIRANTDIEHVSDVDAIFDYDPEKHEQTVGFEGVGQARVSNGVLFPLRRAHRLHDVCMSYVKLIELMGDIYLSEGWDRDAYIDAQDKLSEYVSDWFRIKGRWFFWIADKAHPRTVGFIGALLATAGADDGGSAPSLTVTLIRRDGTDDRVTLT